MSYEQTAFYESPLGLIEIKMLDDKVRSILFVEEQKIVSESHPLIKETILQLQQYFNGERTSFDFAQSQSGTDFQQRVWLELQKISFGKRMSYLQLSKNIGDVKAIRAVGTTNGKNKIAIVIPCHRVVGSDGSLTGYAGGLWRKQWLLNHESKLISRQGDIFEEEK